jgi:hypothetical protein
MKSFLLLKWISLKSLTWNVIMCIFCALLQRFMTPFPIIDTELIWSAQEGQGAISKFLLCVLPFIHASAFVNLKYLLCKTWHQWLLQSKTGPHLGGVTMINDHKISSCETLQYRYRVGPAPPLHSQRHLPLQRGMWSIGWPHWREWEILFCKVITN